MRYFKLLDDVAIPGRWHIGEITFPDGSEPRFWAGIRLPDPGPARLRAEVTRPGRVLDFSLTRWRASLAESCLRDPPDFGVVLRSELHFGGVGHAGAKGPAWS
jgi:hypothetical protein